LIHYQEVASGVAEDRAHIIGQSEIVEAPARTYESIPKTEETNPLEPGEKEECKFYSPGIGLIQEKTLKLVNYAVQLDLN
jgi:hypothetical protein